MYAVSKLPSTGDGNKHNAYVKGAEMDGWLPSTDWRSAVAPGASWTYWLELAPPGFPHTELAFA
jgi:hypothetical protein